MTRQRQIERLGMAYLADKLSSEGIQLAFPEFDSGIDFVAYFTDGNFLSAPVQLKASTKQGFYTNKKYLAIPNLQIIYLWHVGLDLTKIRAFCLPYHKAEEIVDIQQRSRKDGAYFTQASTHLLENLQSFEVTSWLESLFSKGE